ncbi:rifin PIR protein, putative [Plasmodium reichenowi]|uniref:Rifin PIR protein, putative n=1 Tax=Plasmodium reichenowi TaxID=5854 RepID=A0A2P9DSD1_PLARE|nr:rifin PIR protein, putative [Plasmodium reichenowi]
MKIHYINILLFALPLNILVHNQRNHKSTIHHTTKIPTTRLLCECELYMPNYGNDPQMKEVMDNFNKQTQERFHEYDERLESKRKHCKDKCDKEIQKIILKDKLEKQMEEQLTTLETKIDTDDIPTCICEKSLADKVEKGCLRCTQNLGGIVAPSTGVLAGIGEAAISVLKPAALKAAAKYAMKEGAIKGAIAGKDAGMNVISRVLTNKGIAEYCPEIYQSIQKIESFTELNSFADAIVAKKVQICALGGTGDGAKCIDFGVRLGVSLPSGGPTGEPERSAIPKMIGFISKKAETTAGEVAKDTSRSVAADLTVEKTNLINTIYGSWETTIIAAVVAIVVIVLIMVIIYKILRYRRKKKMKKKLQYIKLLEE